jgi:membrane fusion protein, heavy metal efflux system
VFRNKCLVFAFTLTLFGCSGSPSPTATPAHKEGDGHGHDQATSPSPPAHKEGDGHEHGPGEHSESEHEAGETPGHAEAAENGHEHGGEEHEKEGELTLKPEQLKMINVVTQAVTMREVRPQLSLPGTVVGDPDLDVKIAGRVAGILESVEVRVGDQVRKGQSLATLTSPEVARLKGEYRSEVVEGRLASSNLHRRVGLARLGDVSRRPYEEAQKELAQARTSMETGAAQLQLTRKKLERLEILLRDGIASQQQVDEARAAVREAAAKYRQAQTDSQVAQQHLRRESSIQSSGIQIDSEAFQARSEITRREQGAQSLRDVLLSYGTDPDAPGGRVVIQSPIDGIVTDRPKSLGEQVQPGELILSLLNPSRVWVWVDLPQESVGDVQLQSAADVRVSAYPDRAFTGRITFIAPAADPDTKKIRARVELSNPQLRLRPNMLAQVKLGVGKPSSALAVPTAAVVQMENKPVVYLQEAPGTFHRRTIEVGERAAGWVVVRSGLRAGDVIAVQGAPGLRAEDTRASSGEEGHNH